MERLLLVVKKLRVEYNFHGYIHLKGIPKADPLLMHEAARYADRMSYNIELPSEKSLKLLAPQKSKESLLTPMKALTAQSLQFREEKRKGQEKGYFLPAGQTTQMIIGASPEADGQILRLTQSLYRVTGLKRVYYSSYVPVVRDSLLPDTPTGQLREHRLYQADWLLRFYGFSVEELLSEGENLSMEFDPKCAWALKNMHLFPVEINRAPLEVLLRVPGIGAKNAYKIMEARKYTKLSFEDLTKMRVALKRAKHFITCNGKFFGAKNETAVRGLLSSAEEHDSVEQLNLFSMLSTPQNAMIALTGQM
jgi:putative DNA modification/repair radical SAM protein